MRELLFTLETHAIPTLSADWQIWLHAGSDLLTAAAYFSIPALIVLFIRRRREPRLVTPGILFAAFISACGITHLLGAISLYRDVHLLTMWAHTITATISAVTAVILWQMLPGALAIPSREDLLSVLEERDRIHADTLAKQEEIEARDRDLDLRLAELEVANEELRQFAYAASHDLKSPANTLSLWLSEFRDEHGQSVGEEGRESIRDAVEVVERMRTLVEDILIYSRVVSATPAPPVAISLREVAETVLADQRLAIRQVGANVNLAIPPDLTVIGHPTQLSMLFVNLLSNSLTFVKPGRTPEIDITARAEGDDRVVVRFSDNGVGIAREHAEKIFRIFSRLHPAGEYPGNGLGLALCRRIAMAHDGTIALAPAEGDGATFEITLAREPADVATARAA